MDWEDFWEFIFKLGAVVFVLVVFVYLPVKSYKADIAMQKAELEEIRQQAKAEYDRMLKMKAQLESMGVNGVEEGNVGDIHFININGQIFKIDNIENVEEFNVDTLEGGADASTE